MRKDGKKIFTKKKIKLFKNKPKRRDEKKRFLAFESISKKFRSLTMLKRGKKLFVNVGMR